MLDHVSLRVQNFERALAFYRAALAPIGYEVVMEFSGAAGLGAGGKPDLWIMQSEPPMNPTHIAFASERAMVDAFHAAAIAAGGSDNGAPGLRPEYHPHYYGAFVFDPEGNNIEVVSHAPPGAPKPAVEGHESTPTKAVPKANAKAKAKPKARAKMVAKAKVVAKPAKAKPEAKPAKAKAKTISKSAKKRR